MRTSVHRNVWQLIAGLSVTSFAIACGDNALPVAPSKLATPAVESVGAQPGADASQPLSAGRAAEVDRTWYNGQEYLLLFPSAGSANENQFTFGCFNLGPDQTDKARGNVGTLYGVIVSGTTHDSCPDGSVQHDHVVSAVPGVPGYTPFWDVVFVQAGPTFDPAIIPLTSEAAIFAAEAAGQVVLTPAGFVVKASIVGRG